jgi:hypothetical protein
VAGRNGRSLRVTALALRNSMMRSVPWLDGTICRHIEGGIFQMSDLLLAKVMGLKWNR